MKEVNDALSAFYGRPVVGGFTNTGWPVIRPAEALDDIIDGGVGKDVPPAVMNVLRAQARLFSAIEALSE